MEPPGRGGDSGDPPPDAQTQGKADAGGSSKGRTDTSPPETPVSSSAARIQSADPSRSAGAQGPRPVRRAATRTPDRALQDLWVARLREGDGEALREVVHAFAERLTAVVSGILRDRDAVEDVVQETFTKAYYRIASFKGGSSLYTWLYRVAVNATKDYIKSRKRRPAASFDDMPGRAALPSAEAPLMEGLERRELRMSVRASIAKLPTRFRTVLALRELEGMTYNEIADALDLSLGTVESRLFRARKRLRALLVRESQPSSVGRRGPKK